jgi:hypothetical protein
MLATVDAYATLQPLIPLLDFPNVRLEEDLTTPGPLSPHREVEKLREIQCLDSLQEEWDPHTAVVAILEHHHTRYARRQEGKSTHDLRTALITSKGVRVLAKFFDESKS